MYIYMCVCVCVHIHILGQLKQMAAIKKEALTAQKAVCVPCVCVRVCIHACTVSEEREEVAGTVAVARQNTYVYTYVHTYTHIHI